MASIEERVVRAVRRVEAHAGFQEWATGERLGDGDLVLVNNSFVFREVQTEKSALYLAAEVSAGGHLKTPPSVIRLPNRQNLDFRRIATAQRRPALRSLQSSITEQRATLGHLVFGLIGSVSDDRRAEVLCRSVTPFAWPRLSLEEHLRGYPGTPPGRLLC